METNTNFTYDSIELRSEKVRSIIGQIPPRLIRIGISILFLIFLIAIIGSYFIKYESTITTSATLTSKANQIHVVVNVPSNKRGKIKKGQKVILKFDNLPNLFNQSIETFIPITVSSPLYICKNGGFFLLELYLPNTTKTKAGESLIIIEPVNVNATIVTENVSLLERIFEPLLKIWTKQQHSKKVEFT